jgi:hypothetical protein
MRPTVLLVGGGSETLSGLGRSLAEVGFDVEVAPDGFYAALLLERRRPAAIVVPSSLPDMRPQELGQILASDPDLAAVQRILVPLSAEELPDAETAEHFHLVLPLGATPDRLALLVQAALDPARAAAGPKPTLAGTLEAVEFAPLTQLLAETRLVGVLRIGFADGEALVYFHRGEVIHCRWGEIEGRRAFQEILRASLSASATFRFDKLGLTEAFRVPRTMGGPVQNLLLAAAVGLDEGPQPGRKVSGGGPAGAS